jgi:hypothetical protein
MKTDRIHQPPAYDGPHPAVRRAAADAAAAVHRRIRGQMEAGRRDIQLARVVQVEPYLKARLFAWDTGRKWGETLEEYTDDDTGDLFLSQFLRWWDRNYGIEKNDVLLCMPTRAPNYWIAFDVRTKTDINAGIRPSKPPPPGSRDPMMPADASADWVPWTGPHHVVKKLEVYDKEGNRIGWVPVFNTLPATVPSEGGAIMAKGEPPDSALRAGEAIWWYDGVDEIRAKARTSLGAIIWSGPFKLTSPEIT